MYTLKTKYNDKYESHKKRFTAIFIGCMVAIIIQVIFSGITASSHNHGVGGVWVIFLRTFVALFPIWLFMFMQPASEDCINCFRVEKGSGTLSIFQIRDELDQSFIDENNTSSYLANSGGGALGFHANLSIDN